MKKILYSLLIASGIALTGCSWLDINPETGLDESEVFTVWDNYKSYFNYVYGGTTSGYETNITLGYPAYLDTWNLRFTWAALTDMADCGRLVRAQNIKAGTLGANVSVFTTDLSRRPISYSMFKIIRICNKAIANIDRIRNCPSEEDKKDILGQAYFVRGYAHFVLCRYFGGMPYLDKALEADDEWDLPRMSSHDTYLRCAEDFEEAWKYLDAAGKARRDAGPGQPGHLNAPDQNRPNGVAAKAMKARALLYAASPLSNVNGDEDWKAAASACSEALSLALENSFDLLPIDSWQNNFIKSRYTNEQIWAHVFSAAKANAASYSCIYTYAMSNYTNASGDCPTQNFVDKFETIYGEPLETPEQREAAALAGHYNEQNPYAGRDPRLDLTVLHDGSVVAGCATGVNFYYDPDQKMYPGTKIAGASSQRFFGHEWGATDGKGMTNTGYMVNKWWDGKFNVSYNRSDPLIRLAELYLNYAEAVNEAYGPDGKAGDIELSAVEAVNVVRARAGMPPVLSEFTSDKESFRERIRNERTVELAFEGHHYYLDIRRWKIAPKTMTKTLMGMYVEKVPVSAEYPLGRKFERRAIPSNRQSTWKDAMYYIPFPVEEANKMKNFVNNPIW
ncbi:MAG: RagB/SusD family nutrient uptake outer membrane protein [Candidatus Cryptobacteroides sp.]|nr:RagB/SusD family nutrient uptake outer membrane protein [Candidatus Cryptobacteroides sp.]